MIEAIARGQAPRCHDTSRKQEIRKALAEQERVLVERVIEEAGGNLTLAASRLGLHRITLHKLLKRTGKAPAKSE